MHRISALFNKRPIDGKHSDVDEDTPSHVDENSNDSGKSSQNLPRLVRSPGIRGLRNPDDVDVSGISINGTDHCSESGSMSASGLRSTANLSSMYPSNVKMGSPLPSPPRSPNQVAIQASSLWPLPSPRQLPKKNEDNHMKLNGLELSENGHGLVGEMHKSVQSMIPSENHKIFSSPSGMIVSSSPRVGGKGFGSSGVGLPYRNAKVAGFEGVHTHVQPRQVGPSTSNGKFSHPVRGPHESAGNQDSWLWKPEQIFHGYTTVADESLGAEYSSMAKYSYQNGASSRDAGYSRHQPQTAGSPTTFSPPRSPSAIIRISGPGLWQKGNLLGSGAFGNVYKGIHSGTGEFCAIKEVEFYQNDHRSRESAAQLKKEIASLSTLQHPNIVQYKGSELVGDSLYIYLELISGGSLYKLYQEFRKLEEPVIRRYTRQILFGLQFLHSRKFVHRDIKCANILVDQDGTIKLADFGVAKYIKEQGVPFSLRGSPHWMAPEVIMSVNTGYEFAVDIWSLGCTVIEMVTGRPPWCDLEAAAAMFKITKVGAPPIPEGLSPDGQSFLRLCLQRNPADRPTAATLLDHPFVHIEGDAYHTTVHAFETLKASDLGKARASSSVSPAASAPCSPPRSLHRPIYSTQSDLVSVPRNTVRGLPSATSEQNKAFGNSSTPPNKRSGKPRSKIPSSGNRRGNEFTPTQAGPSWSAPVSPKSSHGVYVSLHPTRSADNLPGYLTPFSESRGNPRHSS